MVHLIFVVSLSLIKFYLNRFHSGRGVAKNLRQIQIQTKTTNILILNRTTTTSNVAIIGHYFIIRITYLQIMFNRLNTMQINGEVFDEYIATN